jgi:hypothetical protein
VPDARRVLLPGARAVAFLAVCCAPPRGTTSADVPSYGVPAIVSASADCNPQQAQWRFELDTDAWTGGGALLWSANGSWVEEHRLDSKEAADDGSSDHLELALTIVPDWRDQEANASTALNCETPGLGGVLTVFARDGKTVADCRFLGDDQAAFDAWELGVGCETPLDTGG